MPSCHLNWILISIILMGTCSCCVIKNIRFTPMICSFAYRDIYGKIKIGPDINLENEDSINELKELFYMDDEKINEMREGRLRMSLQQMITIYEAGCKKTKGRFLQEEVISLKTGNSSLLNQNSSDQQTQLVNPNTRFLQETDETFTKISQLKSWLYCFVIECNQGIETLTSFSFNELRFHFIECLKIHENYEDQALCLRGKYEQKYPCIFHSCRPFYQINKCKTKELFESFSLYAGCYDNFFELNQINLSICRSGIASLDTICFTNVVKEYLSKLHQDCREEQLQEYFMCLIGEAEQKLYNDPNADALMTNMYNSINICNRLTIWPEKKE